MVHSDEIERVWRDFLCFNSPKRHAHRGNKWLNEKYCIEIIWIYKVFHMDSGTNGLAGWWLLYARFSFSFLFLIRKIKQNNVSLRSEGVWDPCLGSKTKVKSSSSYAVVVPSNIHDWPSCHNSPKLISFWNGVLIEHFQSMPRQNLFLRLPIESPSDVP